MGQIMLTSSTERFCPGDVISFICNTTGSSILVWTSEEYIGASGSQIEFASIDNIGITKPSLSNPDTVATLTAISMTDGMTVLISMLCIATRSTTPSVTVSCLNAGGMNSTSIIQRAGM